MMRSLGFISLVFIVKHVGAQESVSVTNDTILIQDNVDNFFVPYNDENISNVKVNNVARKANAIISDVADQGTLEAELNNEYLAIDWQDKICDNFNSWISKMNVTPKCDCQSSNTCTNLTENALYCYYSEVARKSCPGRCPACPKQGCIENEYECENGRCIESSKKCDGFHDCADATDETNCTIHNKPQLRVGIVVATLIADWLPKRDNCDTAKGMLCGVSGGIGFLCSGACAFGKFIGFCPGKFCPCPSAWKLCSSNPVNQITETCDLEFWKWFDNVAKMKEFFICAKTLFRDAGSEHCFDCICSISDVTSIIGLEVPCCDGTCGPICEGIDHECTDCSAMAQPDPAQSLQKVELSPCNGFCLKNAYTEECGDLTTYKLKVQNATSQSEKSRLHAALKGIDGVKTISKKEKEKNFFATKDFKGSLPWFQVELKEESVVWKVLITNRIDCCTPDQFKNLHITVGNSKITDEYIVNKKSEISQNRNTETYPNPTVITSQNNECGKVTGDGTKGRMYLINCVATDGKWPRGKYVTVQYLGEENVVLTFRELEVFGTTDLPTTEKPTTEEPTTEETEEPTTEEPTTETTEDPDCPEGDDDCWDGPDVDDKKTTPVAGFALKPVLSNLVFLMGLVFVYFF